MYGENTSLVVNSTVFKSNKAKSNDGGAINVQKTITLNLHHCLFEDNSARSLGGAINVFSHGILKVNGTQFTRNKASSEGGAIRLTEQVQMMVSNCTFEGNSGYSGGSIDGSFGIRVEVIETVFTKSQAKDEGGAIIVIQQSHLSVTKCVFHENSARLGGAIHGWNNATVIIYESNFTKNTGSRGGAIHVTKGDFGEIQLLTDNCVFHENFANEYGGALSGLYNRNVKIEKCTFSNNANERAGGAITVGWIEKMSITQCTFNNNKAAQAGAMYLQHMDMIHLRNITFSKNKTLAIDGGTISFSHAQIKIEECYFHEGTAVGYGAAISGTGSKNIIMQNSKFVKNEAGEGGAIFFRHISSFQINETMFAENKATLKGGAMALNLNISSDIYNCLFNANIGGQGGAITMDNYVHAELDSVTFLENIARGNAGALGVEMGQSVSVNMRNISCIGNRAGLHGGCIGSRNYAEFTMYECKFSRNEAGIFGDAYAGVDTSLRVRKFYFSEFFYSFVFNNLRPAQYL